MSRLLPQLQEDFDNVRLTTAVPTWHGESHYIECHTKNHVQDNKGTGKNDCEAPERVWAITNPISFATKEMGVGTQHNAIEDFIDYHNFGKNINLGKYLDLVNVII